MKGRGGIRCGVRARFRARVRARVRVRVAACRMAWAPWPQPTSV